MRDHLADDSRNIPPYDTWVWWVRNVTLVEYSDHVPLQQEADHLVAFVPPDFIALADAGIKANPESCIRWIEDLDDDFVRSLRRMNLPPQAR
jgi:hypothetical protein